MKTVAWVTDSTAHLDEELKNHPHVYQIPLSILLDQDEYLDGIDLSPKELYDRLKTLNNPPKTSQPSIGAFVELYERLEKEYESAISILLSSKLSGTVSSSEQAAKLVKIPITTIDSYLLSYPLTVQIKKAMRLFEGGYNPSEIKSYIENYREKNETYVLVGSLEQLHRSGRMNGIQFFLGSMLNMKPIISLKNGELEVKEKARSEKKAKEKIVQYLKKSYDNSQVRNVSLLYGLHKNEALNWQQELEVLFPDIIFNCYPLGATIGVHAGENTVGISWYNQEND